MKNLYKFKWPLIILSIGVLLEKFAFLTERNDVAEIAYLLQILALAGIIWKLLFVENK